ncbi:MAG: helix-turn-helix domain-containing protein [Flammeovirgaceae bacterium]|nr:helix-turn-helix domain-containing protein [Flammeovirgaceae bacterium]
MRKQKQEIKTLFEKGWNKSQIARELNIPRSTIICNHNF